MIEPPQRWKNYMTGWLLYETIGIQMTAFVLAFTVLIGGAAGGPSLGLMAADPNATSSTALYEFLVGRHLESEGDVDGAIAAYERAARLDPTSAEILAGLAALYFEQNRPTEALQAGERALKIGPANTEANRILGMVYTALAQAAGPRSAEYQGYLSRAIAHLERGQSIAHPSVTALLGQTYVRTRAYDKAIAVLEPYVEGEPDHAEAVSLLGQAYRGAGKLDQAIAFLQNAAANSPRHYLSLAETFEIAHRWEEAAERFVKAEQMGIAPEGFSSAKLIAQLRSKDGDQTKYLAVLQKMIEINPQDPLVHNHLGIYYYERGELNRAIEVFTGALRSPT
jgi:tetratricopeptide (TPR) repeat protein